jgi:amidophosphoribosyltransferase
VLPRLAGAYSFVIMDETRLIGARDPYGFRLTAISPEPGGFCTACMTGDYPVPIPGLAVNQLVRP